MIVEKWFFDRFGNGFKTGEMNNQIKLMILENLLDGFVISKVILIENWSFSRDLSDFVNCGSFAIDEVVYNNDFVAFV